MEHACNSMTLNGLKAVRSRILCKPGDGVGYSMRNDVVNEQLLLKAPLPTSERLLRSQRALSKLHAQVLKLNKTVKEASGQRHLKLIKR